jgi:hypothetical protein
VIKESFKPTAAKILGVIIIFALFATYAFVPTLTNPQACVTNCMIEVGYPFKFFFYTFGTGTQSNMNYNVITFIIDFLIFYFALCLLSLIVNLGRRKNVPGSDSRGRDSSPANEAGV